MQQKINSKQYWKRNCKQFTNIFSVKMCGLISALFFIGAWLVDSSFLFFLGSLIFISIPASILMIYNFRNAFSQILFYKDDPTVYFTIYCDKAFEKPFKLFTSIGQCPNFLILAEIVERITYEDEKHNYDFLINKLHAKLIKLSFVQISMFRLCCILNIISVRIAADYIFKRYAHSMSNCFIEYDEEESTE